MKINTTNLANLYEIENRLFKDERGFFVKTYHAPTFIENSLENNFTESFYSTSHKGVLRGMHFQLPPYDHTKLVYCASGEILDVVVDIRIGSKTFGNYFSTILSAEKANALYIGRGYAHGFLTLSESATMVYMTSTVHAPDYDAGIRWDSFGFDWGIDKPIISTRDLSFNPLNI
ncbi:dTDP-4-dehydrorhamnose 3,5-epimerase [Pectobacterium versatile]|uniref:dTDP-4-dehydrorhamnose 3,5-epimerase n=1 Tax=Pectobacterium versatile TaxID=2488639 RepID=A0AAW3RYE9_9GAMM|nr:MULTISPECIES: dTDP-4-dehydrorhamnose 3,5-epimerase [Pectobacterium]ASN86356.1 dTDP-4-dehydrorhamnose 3,5-epimerase [Pectobacterium versatile]MBA0161262.1 dTDP-4-dehydrorhamnose 3,5-epimerase [Pectobacterium versatile]MBN3238209.1 dTDP-4-dehydrorhamnose 3,5-epimerase [Pectobacterium versatile]MBQ4763694.1 dTDP-4-dehydrorhamnose 3,5-epimerase [Pectobacterium versatile]MCL6386627.1 dTDP-4-dehydrorhamnose 3,5-epimerase [Pectobacterium carotovorum subsp. carotovorum]